MSPDGSIGGLVLQLVFFQEHLVEPDAFGQSGYGDVFVHCVAAGVLGIGHAHRRETQGVFRQGVEMPPMMR